MQGNYSKADHMRKYGIFLGSTAKILKLLLHMNVLNDTVFGEVFLLLAAVADGIMDVCM